MKTPPPITLSDARHQELYEKWVQGNEYFSMANGRADFITGADYPELLETFSAFRKQIRFHQARKVLTQDCQLGPLADGIKLFEPANGQDRGARTVPNVGTSVVVSYDLIEIIGDRRAKAQSLRLLGVEVARILPNDNGTWDTLQMPVLRMGSFHSMCYIGGNSVDAAEAAHYAGQTVASQINCPRGYY